MDLFMNHDPELAKALLEGDWNVCELPVVEVCTPQAIKKLQVRPDIREQIIESRMKVMEITEGTRNGKRDHYR